SAVSVAITASGINCAGTSGTLTAAGFGGTPPYAYSWQSPAGASSGETVPVAAPGNYFVTVMDASGCASIGAFTVPNPILVDVLATDIPCSYYPDGGAVTANVGGGKPPYAYSWSNGSTTQMLMNVPAGTYFVTVTGANGCTATDVDNVDIPDPLEVTVVWITPACGGNNNGSAIVQATGGTPPYTHTWSPGGLTGASQTGLAPGTYYVCTFDANGCQKDINVVIPATTGLDVQLMLNSATCLGVNTGSATAVVNPPGNYTYQWSPAGSTTAQLSGLAANTIVSVTVTDPVSGCSGTATGVIGGHNSIDIAVTANDILCAGGFGSATAVASNGTPQYTYTWFSGNTQIGGEASISGLAPGAYMVSVVDAAGCIAQTVANIGIESAPDALIGGGNVLVCGDEFSTVQFTNLSTDPFNQITELIWTVTGPGIDTVINQQNQITFLLPVDVNITVQLIVLSGVGCPDTTTLEYNVPGIPDITLSLDSTSLNCVGDPVGIFVVDGDSTYTYVWNPAVMINPDPLHVLVNPSDTTTYVLTATDGNACTATASITIAPDAGVFQLTVTDDLIQTCSATATLSASASVSSVDFVWTDPSGAVIPGNPVTVPATPTTTIYTVTATSLDGCIETKTVEVTGYGFELSIDSTTSLSGCAETDLPLGVTVSPPSANLNYEWSVTPPATISPANDPNPMFNGPAGDYTVTVIVSNDFCADTLEIPVHISPNMELNEAISADLCDGRVVSFFNNSGMEGVWSFGDGTPLSDATNPVHTYDNAGEYLVTFTPNDAQCTAPWDSMINVQQAALSASIVHNYVDCALQAEILFNGTVNNPGNVTWAWTFSSGTPATSSEQNPTVTFTTEETITATLVVTDINKCTATATAQVEISILNDSIPQTTSICPGESLQLNPGFDAGAVYTWTATPADPTLNVNDPNPTVSPIVPTTYSVQIAQGLCTETFIAEVTLHEEGDVALPNDTAVCNTDLLPITAQSSNATEFEWSTDPNFSSVFSTLATVALSPTSNNYYYVRTTTAAECLAIDSIKIDLAIVDIQALPNNPQICLGEETELVVTNLNPDQILEYAWSPALPGIPNPSVSPTENSTYAVVVTNQYNCTASASFSVGVTWVAVTAEITGPDTICPGLTTTLLATPDGNGTFFDFAWSPSGSLVSPNSAETEAAPAQDEVYTVTVTSDNGCTAADQVQVFFMQTACENPYIFVPKAFTPNGDDKNDYFRARGADIKELKFIVWDRWGEIVYETYDPTAQGWDGTYKGKDLTPDAYAWYLWCTCGNGDTYETKGNVTLLK
ncbi:MAG: T9SS type B sorting domain-containing protein, partial [Saprospiraceae bacterium]